MKVGDLVVASFSSGSGEGAEAYSEHPHSSIDSQLGIFEVKSGTVGMITDVCDRDWKKVLFPALHAWIFSSKLSLICSDTTRETQGTLKAPPREAERTT